MLERPRNRLASRSRSQRQHVFAKVGLEDDGEPIEVEQHAWDIGCSAHTRTHAT